MGNKFTHIGFGNVVQSDRVIFVTIPGTTTAKRYLDDAKKKKKYHDARLGRRAKALIVMDDGTVILAGIRPQTLLNRFNGIDGAKENEEDMDAFNEKWEEGDEEDEDHRADSEGDRPKHNRRGRPSNEDMRVRGQEVL